jgi:L-ascorbate metabolism protein UlaG (beta-lactamase superfamily)
MQLEWYGQSAFRLRDGATTVFIDPWGDMSGLAAARDLRWDYPPITGVEADLLLVTHEHRDHNNVDVVGGDPAIIRSTAGTHESPIGEVVGIASEHDPVAGTQRGHNTLYVFSLGGMRVAHLGDLGQAALRQEQLDALGRVDLLLLPVGAGPTIGAEQARTIVDQVHARLVVPHHYRTKRIDFLDPLDDFGSLFTRVHEAATPVVELDDLPAGDAPLLVVPAAP